MTKLTKSERETARRAEWEYRQAYNRADRAVASGTVNEHIREEVRKADEKRADQIKHIMCLLECSYMDAQQIMGRFKIGGRA